MKVKKFTDLTARAVGKALYRGAYASVHGNKMYLTDPDSLIRKYAFPSDSREYVILWVSMFNTEQTYPVQYKKRLS